jgi:hypothetical protein
MELEDPFEFVQSQNCYSIGGFGEEAAVLERLSPNMEIEGREIRLGSRSMRPVE